jgi:hypothetical protein
MRKLTPTLTQSGLLAVLLQRQRYKISQLAWRRAQRKHMRAALWSTLTWPWRALTAPMPVRHSRRVLRRMPPVAHLNLLPRPIAMSPPIHTYTELQQQIHDDLRIQHPRLGQVKWQIPHVRFVRDVSHENARHFDAKEIQRVYRSS